MAGAVAFAMPALDVNGPEDLVLDWDAIDWRTCEDQVRRLRQRIFKATREQDWKKVRNLQKLMLRSLSNTLVSVRQVTQRNAGRKTAGVDGQVALTSRDRPELAERLHRHAQLSPITAGYVVTVMDDVAQPSVRSIVASSSGVRSGPPTAPRL